MLAPPTGNMSKVYFDFAQRSREIDEAEAAMRRVVDNSRPLDAEITAGATADWYLVRTFPGDDLRCMRHLARRRFGAFRPMQQRRDRRNSTAVQGWEPVFPGWLFVFVWDIKKMKTRLRACPGVLDILCDPVSQEPVPIDQKDADGVGFVDRVRALGWVYEERAPRHVRHQGRIAKISTAAAIASRPPRRPTKHERKQLDRLKVDFKTRRLEWDQETWADANRLDPQKRIALLVRTLRVAPPLQVASSR